MTSKFLRQFIPISLALLMGSGWAAETPPLQVVQGATEELQSLIRQHQAEYRRNRAEFYRTVDRIVAPVFDLDYTARLVLARNWRTATEDQRSRFQAAFRSTLIDVYADTLLEYNDSTRLAWAPANTPADAHEATLHLNIVRSGAPPIAVGFSVRLDGNGRWRVYDVTIEAISLVTNLRSQYSAEIRSHGLDGLIKRLEARSGANGPKA